METRPPLGTLKTGSRERASLTFRRCGIIRISWTFNSRRFTTSYRTMSLPVGGRDIVLYEVVKRLELDVQEIRIIPYLRNVGEALSRLSVFKVPGGGRVSI